MIEIKDKAGKLRYQVSCNEGNVYRQTLMSEDCILLKFSVAEPISFRKGDYVDMAFGRFELVDLVFPVENRSTSGYDYELRLDAPYYKWKNKKLFYTRQGNKEKSWSLTGFIEMHLQVLLENLESLGYDYNENPESSEGTPYLIEVHPEVEKLAKPLSYDNTNILDALSRIAEAWKCEWWVVNQYIHLGKCEYNTAVRLEIGQEVSEMSRSDTNRTYVTRIYAFGSTRNLPINYRPSETGLLVEGVVEKRLMLPVCQNGEDYIDAYTEMLTEEVVEDVVVFEEVYPRRTGSVSELSCSTVPELDSEGKGTGKTLYAYSMKDTALRDFLSSYLIPGNELRAVFQTGRLAGMDFALTLKSSDANGTVFEINRNDTYGITLPNDTLKPSVGEEGKIPADTYVLYGYDTRFVDTQLVALAEAELLEKAQTYVEKSKVDSSVYTCKMNPVRVSGYDGSQPLDLLLGDRVQLVNPTCFEGVRESRIFGFEKRLDHPYEVTYTVGQSTQYSRIGELENKIKELTYKGKTYAGGNGSVYVVGRYDKTVATDRNVFSTLRSTDLFLHKGQPDIAREPISFLKGLSAGSVLIKSHLTRGQLQNHISMALSEETAGEMDVMSLSLVEEVALDGATTLGALVNVEDAADSVPSEDVALVRLGGGNSWTLKKLSEIGVSADTLQRNVRIVNDLDSKNIAASKGEPCHLKFTFISQERYGGQPFEDTGERGLCRISVKNTDRSDFTVVKEFYLTSGLPYSFDCATYLTSGANNILVKVTGEITEESTPAFVYTVQLTSLSLSANNFKWWTAYTGDITLPLNIGGNISKTLYVQVTGVGYKKAYQIPIGVSIYLDTAYNYPIAHPGKTGVFHISAFITNSDGTIKTGAVSFQVICALAGAQKKLIAINNVLAKATNWVENSLFDYAMYDGDNVYTSARFLIQKEEVEVFSSSEDSIATGTKYTFSFPLEVDTMDNSEFSIGAQVLDGNVSLTTPILFTVNNSLGYSAVPGAVMYVNPRTRSNRQGNYQEVVNEIGSTPIATTWKNMNWGNDGWTVDADGNRVLRLMAGSLLTLDYTPFKTECARTGKTIEIDYKIDNVTHYTKPVLTISTPSGDSFVGLNLYADEVIMHSQSLKNDSVQSLHTFEGRRTKLALTILPDAYGNSGFNLCMLYINGVKNREFTYENNDYFAHSGGIVIGSDDADVDIYGIREYNSALTSQGVLINYINWMTDTAGKASIKRDNDILDANGSEIDFENTKDQFNVLVFDQTIPSMADQSTRKGTLEVFFMDHPEWNVSITHVTAKGQGTSSKKYWIWNTSYGLDKSLSVVTRADGSTTTKKWQMVPEIPAGQKFTAKKNFASSMQSHKIGAVNSYTDLYKEMNLLNEAMSSQKYADARVSVYQLPFICFEKSMNEEGETVYTFKGLYTFGPDKGDKYTFGYDADLFPGLIAVEGSDNSPLCTLFRVPWHNNVAYHEEEEAFQYNGANSWDFGGGETANISKFIPAYNLVYACSPRLLPFMGTLNELNAQKETLRTQPYEFWIANPGDVNQYNVYYFEPSQSLFITSDIGGGTINLVSQLVDQGYGLTTAGISGRTSDELNLLFINARVAKFRAEASLYWDIDDALFFINNVEFNAGTDERAKNTYPYCFGTDTSKWRWRVDDADTRFDTTNRGLPDKSYSVETHDADPTGASIWNGETNNFFNLMELAFPSEKIASMRKSMVAMQSLSGLKSGNDLEKMYAFYQKYFFDQAQEYFPINGYNADAKFAYEYGKLAYINGSYTNDTDPITQSLGDHYLAEQRWITKRIIYMMSKYSFGLFAAGGTDTITVRAAGHTIKYELTPAMDLYPAISNGTSIIRGTRTKAGEVCRMEIELSGSGDQQNAIQGASYLMDIGDWYDKNVTGSMIIQGRMLRDIRLGSKTEPVLISIRSLALSNCVSLQRLLLSNIATLSGTLNLISCTHLAEVYADGTAITQMRLPVGGGLRVVAYSSYNQYLTLQNYPLMTNAGVGIDLCKGIITDFFVVDCPQMQPMQLLVGIMNAQELQGVAHALKRIRAVGFNETYRSSIVLDKLAELADGSYEGLSSDGLAGEDALPVLDGTLNVFSNAYEQSIEALRNTFKKLILNHTGKLYMSFKDKEVEQIVASKWGDKEGTTKAEVGNIEIVHGTFKGNTNIVYFDEFKYFTNAKPGVEDRAFDSCTALKSISLPESYSAGNMYRMFANCILLESVTIPDSFTTISGGAFNGCLSLKSIKLPRGLISTAERAFYNSGLLSIDIPNGTETIGRDTFNGCSNLEIVIMGENIKSIGMQAFENCLKMTTIVLKTHVPPAFEYNSMGWNNTSTIYVPDEALAAYKTASGWSGNSVKARLKPLSEYKEL